MQQNIPQAITGILIFGRPPLAFFGMIWAIATIITKNPIYYIFGVTSLILAVVIDLVDGWFAARFAPDYKLTHIAERMMNKIVFAIIFPVISVGMMWRFHFVSYTNSRAELLHVVFVLILCVTVLMRENFAHFMKSFALKKGAEEEMSEMSRLRTLAAAPVAAILYSHAFYVPEGPPSPLYFWISWLGNIPLRLLFFIEICFFVINLGSIAAYCRRYGNDCLDDICMDDEQLRRRILSIFPNALTLMNAMMGVLSVFFAFSGRIREAYMILIGAAIFDRLDGALARKLGVSEPPLENGDRRRATFGGILDDIADAVSFCIAPALIFYDLFDNCTIDAIQGLPYGWLAFCYAMMGIVRLIFFTLDTNPVPGFFKGLPTPAAALLITAPLIMLHQNQMLGCTQAVSWGYFCFGLTLIVAILMNIYSIRYMHVGRFGGRHPLFAKILFLLNGISVFTPFFGHFNLLLHTIYLLSPLYTWKINPEIAALENRVDIKQD
jgi:phosphatidylserine synthase